MELHRPATAARKASGGADDGVRDAKGVEDGPTPATSLPPAAERVPRSGGESAEQSAENGGNVRPGRTISDDNIFKMPLFFIDKVLLEGKLFYFFYYSRTFTGD